MGQTGQVSKTTSGALPALFLSGHERPPAADGSHPRVDESNTTPFVELDREDWSRLSASTPLPLTSEDVVRLRGMSDPMDLAEVDTVYRPLSRLLGLYVEGVEHVHAATSTFLGERATRTPFVIGVAGSVAVGKSTTARVLVEMLRRWPETPRVELVTTDGFLLPNAELQRRGLMERKGFPESYDRRSLLRFLTRVKSGAPRVEAPIYDHLTYDVVPDRTVTVSQPDVLVVEGLNVLQPARADREGTTSLAVSDFFDFSIYVDARTRDIERWYVQRFLRLRSTAFAREGSYFRRYADLDDDAAVATARDIWRRINEPNLRANIVPTRSRANLVMTKDADHRIQRVLLRKL